MMCDIRLPYLNTFAVDECSITWTNKFVYIFFLHLPGSVLVQVLQKKHHDRTSSHLMCILNVVLLVELQICNIFYFQTTMLT